MDAMTRIAEAQMARAAHVAALLAKQNVVACGVGYKITSGQVTDEPSVVVSVSRKLPIAQLTQQDLVPPTLDGVTTDVVETGVIRAFAGPRDRWRPVVPPGVSIGHAQVTAGTFGCLVQRGDERFILSNNHILANVNAGRPGDPILQPGPADGGTEADQIAELADYVSLAFGSEPAPAGCSAWLARLWRGEGRPSTGTPIENLVDVALARPLTPEMVSADILHIGVPTGIARATLGTPVQKTGRTTGHTTGQIVQIDVTAQVAYGDQVALFVDQFMASAMSQPGDSGSAVLDMERRVVGLLFAGSDNTTLINPIHTVLTALQIQVVTSP